MRESKFQIGGDKGVADMKVQVQKIFVQQNVLFI